MTYDRVPSVDALMALLAACGDVWDTPDRSGDPVDILDHGLQVAALLAVSHPDDEELQLAGLVHDIGRFLVPATRQDTGGTPRRRSRNCWGRGSPASSPRTSRPNAISRPPTRSWSCPPRAAARSPARAAP
ncbi:HD domain-containing protein [Streptomyces alanosinicus]|uniref:HD domain-containing protein n=1 Tax=Streptomyces alanosinicus TaxID=68171 RepID=A0A919D3P5_9ACTN|nr:HD domain-containing protein [Streptomyces alanosinicus]GHE05062.1 hypothetical protein GCM10010339_39300 [Streptomyces alanosinicus]